LILAWIRVKLSEIRWNYVWNWDFDDFGNNLILLIFAWIHVRLWEIRWNYVELQFWWFWKKIVFFDFGLNSSEIERDSVELAGIWILILNWNIFIKKCCVSLTQFITMNSFTYNKRIKLYCIKKKNKTAGTENKKYK